VQCETAQSLSHFSQRKIMNDTLTVLSQVTKQRRKFDPESRADLQELAYFVKHSKWKDSCPFYLEHPYLDIVSMTQAYLTKHILKSYE
jgi:uncharacterized protein (DUF1684 family)